MALKPTQFPDWATATNYAAGTYAGSANKVVPPNFAEGFNGGYGLPAEWLNERLNNHGQWIRYMGWGPMKRMSETWAQIPGGSWTPGAQRLSSGFTQSVATNASSSNNPTTTYNNPSVTFSVTGAAATTTITTDKTLFVTNTSNIGAYFDVDVSMSVVGANGIDIFFGFADPNAGGPNTSPSRSVMFSKLNANNPFFYVTGNGVTSVPTTTGITPLANAWNNFHIEISQVSGPSNVASFYINGTLIVSTSTNVDLSSASLSPFLYAKNTTGGVNTNTVSFGNLSCGWSP